MKIFTKLSTSNFQHLFGRVHKLGFQIKVSLDCKDYLIERGWDPQYGARPFETSHPEIY